jgi:hypothetical protein
MSEWSDIAGRLAEGARSQVNRDQRRIDAILQLPLRVYHVTERAAYESVLRDGLMSSSTLCSHTQIANQQAFLLAQRTKRVRLSKSIVLRDQKPMPPNRPASCLKGMSPAEWYELLNNFVFFWFQRQNAEAIQAKYKGSVILEFNFRKLLLAHEDCAFLTPINTGYTLRTHS